MTIYPQPTFLLASDDSALLPVIELELRSAENRVKVTRSAAGALASLDAVRTPSLVLLDATLPGMPVMQLLAALRAHPASSRVPVILIDDAVTAEWNTRLTEGAVDDLILRNQPPAYWRLRIDLAIRNHRAGHEVATLREQILRNAQVDRLTGAYNRETMLAMLFRETDRSQRANRPLSVVLFDLDDFGHWNSRLGAEACDEVLCEVASRSAGVLRSYDSLGRLGMDEFLIALPDCGAANAFALAERLRAEVFASPFRLKNELIRMSACFGIAVSHGRSPVVVLHEAEKALESAKADGPESIRCFGSCSASAPAPVTFTSLVSGDELVAW